MMISTKGRYALRLMIDLAQHNTGDCVPLKEITRRQGISEKYVEAIVAVLVKGRLIAGQRGKGGGYRLTRLPDAYPGTDGRLSGAGDLSGKRRSSLFPGGLLHHAAAVATASQRHPPLSGGYHPGGPGRGKAVARGTGQQGRGSESMNASDTQWGKAAACVVLRDGKVLLGRHTYGVGKGLLILPGGYLNHGETPEQAAVREVWEETGVRVETEELVGIRFNAQDWYVIFLARYREGTARAGDEENSEIVWLDAEEALEQDDVPDLTKWAIRSVLRGTGLHLRPYVCEREPDPYTFYG